jgi:hypothetical protein
LSNPFDDLGKQPEWSDDDKKHFERLDYLIHKTFAQSEEGRELLELWKEHLMMSPGCLPTDNDLQVGIREGVKDFIRKIVLTIRKVDSDGQ